MNEKLTDTQIKNMLVARIKLINENFFVYPTIDRDYTNHLISK